MVFLSKNENAIKLIEQNLDKINWIELLDNPNAIHLIMHYQDIIDWSILSANPNIFKIDYDFLRNRMKNSILEDLMINRFHLKNFNKLVDWGIRYF